MLNPPYFPMFSRASRSPAVAKSATLYYPFFLAYATGVLEDNGFSVYLIDAPAEGLGREKTLERIKALNPDLVVCETSTPSIRNDLQVMKTLKEIGIPFIAAVGTHASALADEVLTQNPYVDAIARREYEQTILKLAQSLTKSCDRKALADIEGLSFRIGEEIRHNTDRAFITDLDNLPFVSRVYKNHLRNHMHAYFYGACLHPTLAILSGRGCPFQCAYCVYPQTMTGNTYRLRSVRNVADELEYIQSELPEVKEVFIEDDTLTAKKDRVRSLSEEIIRRNLTLKWSANSRADVDFDTLRLMHRAGCRLLCVGFESGSQEILNNLGKNIQQKQYMTFRRNAARAGLLIHGCFMYGNQGETMETAKNTLLLAKKLNPDTAQFYPIMVYPGTRAYNDYHRKGYITANSYNEWLTSEGLHNCVVSLPGLSKDALMAFCHKSRQEFFLRPGYIFAILRTMLRHPEEAKRILRASTAFFKFLFRLS